ncbi:pyrroloquinoline quinone precursor peptide PqqA [Streptomyces camelliae]|uniref:Coenzyme PQQ synthesis protein A n=1 Tax=Streptomyces camelliae TaxID=3004093 RepID=A0ABY7P0X1_9ACTN|nr:pyrroloquinoline quinone precursor peptide PqqA [Streptomyces sp. HUAS 2-6]WBO62983.1 pyrroloquinoline quinone precursor peptide PqqA [Streptomyces sp. HUAS 2-6]
MDQESVVDQAHRDEWEAPAFEEIRVSAEVTAYMGVWESDDQ